MKPFTLLLLALATPILGACTTTVASETLRPEELEVIGHHAATLAVQASSSPEGLVRGPRIPARELERAIRDAVGEVQLFQPPSDAPDYLLRAAILELRESEYSLDMHASITVRWTLSAGASGETVWQAEITTEHTANTFHAETLDERLLLAVQKATGKNIAAALLELSRLEPLPSPGS